MLHENSKFLHTNNKKEITLFVKALLNNEI